MTYYGGDSGREGCSDTNRVARDTLATENESVFDVSPRDALALYYRKRSTSNAFGLSIVVPEARVKRRMRIKKPKITGVLNLVSVTGMELWNQKIDNDAWNCPSKCGVSIRRTDEAQIERHSRLCLKLRNLQDAERANEECPPSTEEYGTPCSNSSRIPVLLASIDAKQREPTNSGGPFSKVDGSPGDTMKGTRATREFKRIQLRYRRMDSEEMKVDFLSHHQMPSSGDGAGES
mmetsp:Transcript_36297/g.67065  ORF Transcript_36297/g.67065 Transcript_36297/m.67065 type:complete len:234 (-) Transcript_36297:503-1204(-)|eukprot:CAMPEP_0170178248 /NCGR_PEP_ID=MMETSP0040_2-20121228/11763_1 /TAXON_ID=641309 /ORGANISM="Lotharella oceanica, Strain CCMP622" /LENGTH=233 /DNA_ID=CAMNT_0010421257 /DNA_START=84 /DNA_END=785 /DNA_ORIENTATION=-